ncbi:helicase HerA-like domain-containing protein [uncultured Eubacterium sp.]|uniref:helicase HerA-like domain-containing protein n=1 Tax=uncultured Eubacterium sp. TaxID=165185 RepID=UPI000E8D0A1C|nr:helicase HerA-like domain-containing protein [uncultured Eubacterium sp.]HAH18082.1 hypothetical protein [Eubacterium sp.]HAV90284.1 hypothetical protein [Eubacterium sp.]
MGENSREKVRHILAVGYEKNERPKIFSNFYKLARNDGRIVISIDTSDLFKDVSEIDDILVDDYYFQFDEVEGKSYFYIPIDRFGCDNLCEIMNLTEAQKDIMKIIYDVAKGENLKFDGIDDVKDVLDYAVKNAASVAPKYGRINMLGKATFIKAVDEFSKTPTGKIFKECDFDIDALFDVDSDDGITIIRCKELSFNATLFKKCILWLLDEMNQLHEDDDKETNIFVLIEKSHEVFAGLDQEFDAKMKTVLNSLSDKGIQVCLSAHYITEIPEEIVPDLECVDDVYSYLTAHGVETVKEAPGYEYDVEGMIAKIKAASAEHDEYIAEQRANKKKKKKKKSKRAQQLEALQNGQDISLSNNDKEESEEESESEETSSDSLI